MRRMLITRIVFPVLLLAAFLAWADEPDPSQLEARLGEIKARFALTEEQAAQAKLVLEEHFKAQMAILDKYGIDIGSRDSTKRPDYEKLRALREELDASKARTETRFSAILSAEQLAEFEKIQAEGKAQIQENLRSRQMEKMASSLNLTEEQAAQVKPILARHFDARMAILDKHGIGIEGRDGRRRLSFRQRLVLRRHLDGNMTETMAQLATILSAAQLAEFENIQAEQKEEKLRKVLQLD